MKQFGIVLTRRSAATAEAVYDVVANLQSHLTWGGTQQLAAFRLTSLQAPAGPAGVGAAFSSTGVIPMSRARFADSSTVTAAERPGLFEFVTHATIPGGGRPMRATYRHRYEIEAVPPGSMVTYSMTQLDIDNPSLRLALPGVSEVSWRVAIPFFAGRGLKNLLTTAHNAGMGSRPVLQPTK
jgi:hypothetical protein